ncbi:50S ribosomal protein L31 [Candidatus Curtissbacteria bacterium RBG_16_39_7]|uniref:50S ribosomal protein L31 n=1 Tax=Candidatus Curtissbacteria bacterium RBG_16_39_7 TaxID=1797707 RepID=A0A1F5G4S1_9BACT|nr:MAG: 50S ribosomal protein L31 [Candidatus Curtissbacteria bacterium RBG_16_39_7]
MKTDIHPTWYPDAKVTCACGASFTVGSTKPQIHVEICSACHPLFTGEMKYIDTLGRIERFQQKQKAADQRPFKKKTVIQTEEERRPETLKEMVELVKAKRAREKAQEEKS